MPQMRGAGYADLRGVIQVTGYKVGAVSFEILFPDGIVRLNKTYITMDVIY
jgi:hypothetical protein